MPRFIALHAAFAISSGDESKSLLVCVTLFYDPRPESSGENPN